MTIICKTLKSFDTQSSTWATIAISQFATNIYVPQGPGSPVKHGAQRVLPIEPLQYLQAFAQPPQPFTVALCLVW